MNSWGKPNTELDFSILSGKKIKSGTYLLIYEYETVRSGTSSIFSTLPAWKYLQSYKQNL